MADWPDLDAYKAWARIAPGDVTDDAAIGAALDAATTAVLERCPRLNDEPPDGPYPDCPDDVAQAVLLWTNRLFARRNSPTGMVGITETGQALIPSRDSDIARLLSPWREPVLG